MHCPLLNYRNDLCWGTLLYSAFQLDISRLDDRSVLPFIRGWLDWNFVRQGTLTPRRTVARASARLDNSSSEGIDKRITTRSNVFSLFHEI